MISLLQHHWQSVRDGCPFLYSAVLCNPVLIIHTINGLLSILQPNDTSNPIFDTYINAHFDVHSHDNFCRAFAILMVGVQLAIYRPGFEDTEPGKECG